MMKVKAQITVFFSLILLLILALICTSLESARAAGLHLRLRLAADSSLQSVFARYDRTLWENYGLLFWLDQDGEGSGLKQVMCSYAEKNGSGDSQMTGADWFSYEVGNVNVRSILTATDQRGQVFRQAVNDYMRSCGVAEAAWEVFGRLDVIDESGDLTRSGTMWQEQNGKEETDLSRLQEDYESLWEELEELSEAEAVSDGDPAERVSDAEIGSSPAGYEAADEKDRREAQDMVDGLMDMIDRIVAYGFLALVVEDVSHVSAEPLDGEDLPSSLLAEEAGDTVDDHAGSGIADTLIFNEYVIRFLDAYTSEESCGCQVEYVIAGKNSDRENLSSVAGRLTWIREGFNLAYILTDTGKKSQADGIAVTLAGWTGLAPLVKGISMLILTAWSLGESVSDVRRLLDGDKVPMIKTKEDWKLDLTGAASLKKRDFKEKETMVAEEKIDHGDEKDKESDAKGLSYEDYLRILLFFMEEETVTFRTMDVIQREGKKVNPDFRMANCVYGAKAELIITAKTIFPFLPGNVSYEMKTETEYIYGSKEVTADVFSPGNE